MDTQPVRVNYYRDAMGNYIIQVTPEIWPAVQEYFEGGAKTKGFAVEWKEIPNFL